MFVWKKKKKKGPTVVPMQIDTYRAGCRAFRKLYKHMYYFSLADILSINMMSICIGTTKLSIFS
jgi:hypothetical protein